VTHAAARVALSGALCAMVLSSAGCYPSTPSLDPMPMLIVQDSNGAYVATFPWCAGEVLASAGVLVGRASSATPLRLSSSGERAKVDDSVALSINSQTLSSGLLSPGLTVTQALAPGSETDPTAVTSIFAFTSNFEVSVDTATLRCLGGSAWLAQGYEGNSDGIIETISPSDGQAIVGDFCGAGGR
jgi:hypothetical protein